MLDYNFLIKLKQTKNEYDKINFVFNKQCFLPQYHVYFLFLFYFNNNAHKRLD